jgi:phosphohistidine phosphatase
MIFLVHHADAVGPAVDPQRPLSDAGRAHADRLAGEAAARGVRPAAIWHSGKLRARQTAEAFWRRCNPMAPVSAVRGLQPDDRPEAIADEVRGDTRDILLVGHQPNLSRLLALLLTGRPEGDAAFPPHGLVAVEATDQGWSERWRLV